jgi:hypothetical protein
VNGAQQWLATITQSPSVRQHIGEPDLIHKGIGSAALRQFVEEVG